MTSSIVLDALGQVLYASPALGGALGHDPIDVMAEDLRDFVHPEDRTATTALIDHVVDGGEASATLRIRDAAGAWRWFEATMGNLLDTAVGGVVCNLRDVPNGSPPSARCAPRRRGTARSPTARTRACGSPPPTAARCT